MSLCHQWQVKHWSSTGIIKGKEVSVDGVSQDGFIKKRFYQNNQFFYTFTYLIDKNFTLNLRVWVQWGIQLGFAENPAYTLRPYTIIFTHI